MRTGAEFFASQSYTGAAEEDGKIYGLYILHPNNVGRCGHICNASFAVSSFATAFAAFRLGVLNAVAAVGILDISLLLINVLTVWTTARKKIPVLFGIGSTLFLCCDVLICARVSTFGMLHEAAAFYCQWVTDMIHFFYLRTNVHSYQNGGSTYEKNRQQTVCCNTFALHGPDPFPASCSKKHKDVLPGKAGRLFIINRGINPEKGAAVMLTV